MARAGGDFTARAARGTALNCRIAKEEFVKSLIILGALVGLAGCGGVPADPAVEPRADTIADMDAGTIAEVAEVVPDPADTLTGPQRNARRNATEFLSMTGFSREGLIEQLSSEYGSGYAVADATAAVDSLDVDWNEQAVRSAQSFLEMTGFSCNGLIEQLSADAGSKFTRAQAEYGAAQAGAC